MLKFIPYNGQMVHSVKIYKGPGLEQKIVISAESLQKGVYLILITSDLIHINKRIIKQ